MGERKLPQFFGIKKEMASLDELSIQTVAVLNKIWAEVGLSEEERQRYVYGV